MKVEEIKANELVEKYQKQKVSILYYENSIPNIVHSEMINKSAIQCAIISHQREVDLLERLNKEFVDDKYCISSSNFICFLLQEAQEVLTILKAM